MSKAKSERKARQDAAAAELQKAILQTFDEDLAAVGKLQDPAEKLLKLEQIETDIEGVIKRTNTEITSQPKTKWFAPFLSITGGSGATLFALAILAHVPVVSLAALPAALIGAYVGDRREVSEKKRLTEASAEFFPALETQKAQAATLSDNLVKTELPALARSPKFINLLAASPSLRDHCTAAFSKQASAQEENVIVEQSKPNGKSLTL